MLNEIVEEADLLREEFRDASDEGRVLETMIDPIVRMLLSEMVIPRPNFAELKSSALDRRLTSFVLDRFLLGSVHRSQSGNLLSQPTC